MTSTLNQVLQNAIAHSKDRFALAVAVAVARKSQEAGRG